ncbi:hypothetical protein [Burkholderia sp. Ac-20349]|uniref:hypothetical protein n=1 Tax=Burkholderia sp. Ac-20349 TaxID=2703893 RepID=UPI00197B9E49|nr:hypothetical protein [Burkholderia sp. Ac-20349]MBN3844060.1 hypothetical protein [Burkholderia sp. Ac-20349]
MSGEIETFHFPDVRRMRSNARPIVPAGIGVVAWGDVSPDRIGLGTLPWQRVAGRAINDGTNEEGGREQW